MVFIYFDIPLVWTPVANIMKGSFLRSVYLDNLAKGYITMFIIGTDCVSLYISSAHQDILQKTMLRLFYILANNCPAFMKFSLIRCLCRIITCPVCETDTVIGLETLVLTKSRKKLFSIIQTFLRNMKGSNGVDKRSSNYAFFLNGPFLVANTVPPNQRFFHFQVKFFLCMITFFCN